MNKFFLLTSLLVTFTNPIAAQVTHPNEPSESTRGDYTKARPWVELNDTIFDIVILSETEIPGKDKESGRREIQAIISHVYKGDLTVGHFLTINELSAPHTSAKKHRMRLYFINKKHLRSVKNRHTLPPQPFNYFFRDEMNPFETGWHKAVVFYTSSDYLRAVRKVKETHK